MSVYHSSYFLSSSNLKSVYMISYTTTPEYKKVAELYVLLNYPYPALLGLYFIKCNVPPL